MVSSMHADVDRRRATPGPRAPGLVSTGRRYASQEFKADCAIHILGVLAGLAASALLVAIAYRSAKGRPLWPVLVYVACALAMLCCSAVYHMFRGARQRAFLRRLDHAAIFLMIAGTDTPFTIYGLHGGWRLVMTGAAWLIALAGAVMMLRYPRAIEWVALPLYLGLGWMSLIAWKPLLASIDAPTGFLIGIGGVLYSIGVGFHLWRALPFQKAIWHGLVLVAAGCHYAAVLRLVLLPGARL